MPYCTLGNMAACVPHVLAVASMFARQKKEFYKLRPANKTDHFVPIMAIMYIMSYVHEIHLAGAYNVVQNPQMVLPSEKGARGVSARSEKACMLLPQRS